MKTYTCEQGTTEWFRLRLGIPTASEFDHIVTPAGKLSASSRAYAYRLVAERVLVQPTESLNGIEHMERGKELEPKAVRQYEFAEEVETYKVGFVTTDDGRIGASPDRLITGAPRAVEIKCPAPHVLIGYMLEGRAEKYRPQVQGQLLVGELEAVDLYAFHPQMPPVLLRTWRDEPYLRTLRDALDRFCDLLDALEHKVRSSGVFQPHPYLMTPTQFEAHEINERLPEWARF